jgi:hypothetical protein
MGVELGDVLTPDSDSLGSYVPGESRHDEEMLSVVSGTALRVRPTSEHFVVVQRDSSVPPQATVERLGSSSAFRGRMPSVIPSVVPQLVANDGARALRLAIADPDRYGCAREEGK